jgi:hypothetical protein
VQTQRTTQAHHHLRLYFRSVREADIRQPDGAQQDGVGIKTFGEHFIRQRHASLAVQAGAGAIRGESELEAGPLDQQSVQHDARGSHAFRADAVAGQ